LTKSSILNVNLLETSGIESSAYKYSCFDYTIHKLS